MSFGSVALLSKFTQYPRATGQRLPQEQALGKAHDASCNDRLCHWFPSVLNRFFGKDFCLQLSMALQMGNVSPLPFGHIVCLPRSSTAVRFNSVPM